MWFRETLKFFKIIFFKHGTMALVSLLKHVNLLLNAIGGAVAWARKSNLFCSWNSNEIKALNSRKYNSFHYK